MTENIKLRAAILTQDESTAKKALPFVDTIEMFNRVVDSCCSTLLLPSYKTDIEQFTNMYQELGISITLKVRL